ncbi:MAG: Rrf2 family transcriptional regulator [Actinobacteria bacterium]|nr:Rrf2 family transcriptional regulator [Actinomycetota bacterium]
MKLSRECRYALVGLTTLASKPPGAVVGAAALSEEAGLPPPFMAKILQQLAKRGILVSYRGSPRGYQLARPAQEITVREVLEAIDGDDLFQRCVFFSETCNADSPCALHDVWAPVMLQTVNTFSKMTLADIDAALP